jgi:putative copper export protein
MDWLVFAIQWLHVLGGVFWFGSVLTLNFIIIPGVFMRLEPERQRDVGRLVNERLERVIFPIAVTVIALGVVRGTLFGPIKTPELLFGTAYGLTWLVALALAIFILAYGKLYLSPAAARFYADDAPWVPTADGTPPAAFTAGTHRLIRLALVDLVALVAVFTAMILMRFGA